MKILAIMLMILTSSISASTSDCLKYAYQGDYNLMHKSILIENMEYPEAVLAMAYYYYNLGEEEAMRFWLEHLNLYFQGMCK